MHKIETMIDGDLESCIAEKRRRLPMVDSKGPHPEQSWMSKVDDDVPVSSLCIPGTHDSAAFTQPWPFVATQNMTIAQQLDAGIRYFDLRCGLVRDAAVMVHGSYLLGLQLYNVLDTMYTFLDDHPSEGLIVQIKEDRKAEQSKMNFAQAIYENMAERSERWRTANTTPSMGELRGKMQLLRRYNGPEQMAYGIDVTGWQDNPVTPFTIYTQHQVQLTIQDHYSFSDPLSLPNLIASKGGDVSGLLEKANVDLDPEHWYINFTSAFEFNLYYQITPRAIAVGGYYGFHWEDGMNPRLRNYLSMRPGPRRLGIVVMDFPDSGSDDLIGVIIASNFANRKSRQVLCVWILLGLTTAIMLILWLQEHHKVIFHR